jgi:(p)ppGpp synthase/HD superfamily hydrolase
VDSVSLRKQYGYFWKKPVTINKIANGTTSSNNKSKSRSLVDDQRKQVPVKLYWLDMDDSVFLTEIVVHCQDRKLLLADCSEVVSETVEIVKTGSLTTEEHATLTFLVRVTGLRQLQQLMDRLSHVMSVERRFGSDLM